MRFSLLENKSNWNISNMSPVQDWLIEHVLTSPTTLYRLYGRRFLQVKRPNQQYQSIEGTSPVQDGFREMRLRGLV